MSTTVESAASSSSSSSSSSGRARQMTHVVRLSPNEEAQFKQAEFARLRRERLQQVRRQEREAAERRREAYQRTLTKHYDQLLDIVESQWQQENTEEAAHLEQLLNRSLKAVGAAHADAHEAAESKMASLVQRRDDAIRDHLVQTQRFYRAREQELETRAVGANKVLKQKKMRDDALAWSTARTRKLVAHYRETHTMETPDPESLPKSQPRHHRIRKLYDGNGHFHRHGHEINERETGDHAVVRCDLDSKFVNKAERPEVQAVHVHKQTQERMRQIERSSREARHRADERFQVAVEELEMNKENELLLDQLEDLASFDRWRKSQISQPGVATRSVIGKEPWEHRFEVNPKKKQRDLESALQKMLLNSDEDQVSRRVF